MCKELTLVSYKKSFNHLGLQLDPSIFSKTSIFDFFDKNKAHFNSQQPYQFLHRLNYAFDCFLLAIHYNLYLTYYIYYLHFGFGVKTRTKLPLYKFNRWFPLRLNIIS